MWGSGGPVATNPDFFMDKVGRIGIYIKMTETFAQGVVHVGINYRLGALGFTALEGETWGNQGLRDQVEGIRVFIVKRGRFTHYDLLIKKMK